MAVDRVESLRAYRATLQRRFDQASHAALEPVPGGEWDGMEVIRRKALEDVIHRIAEADPEPVPTVAEVRTPGRVFVDAVCPRCDLPTRVLLEISTELVVTVEGSEIRAKGKSKAQTHTCGQLPLSVDEDDDDDQQLTIGDLVGETVAVVVLRSDAPRPDDATLELPEDERCGAETEIEDGDGEPVLAICERPVDHDANPDLVEPREHWAEGGFAWYAAERPAPAETEETEEEGTEE